MSFVPEASINAESAHPAIEDYHEFLAANRQTAADSQEMLARLSEERWLVFRGEPFSRYLRPHFVTAGQYAVIKDVVSTLGSAMLKLRRATIFASKILHPARLRPAAMAGGLRGGGWLAGRGAKAGGPTGVKLGTGF